MDREALGPIIQHQIEMLLLLQPLAGPLALLLPPLGHRPPSDNFVLLHRVILVKIRFFVAIEMFDRAKSANTSRAT
jgi:hypothetical protein